MERLGGTLLSSVMWSGAPSGGGVNAIRAWVMFPRTARLGRVLQLSLEEQQEGL